MPNPHRGEYQAELGGEMRTFRYSLNKLANLQEKLGVKSINAVVADLNDLGFAALRYLIWLGIAEYNAETKKWDGPDEMEVGEWELDLDTLAEHLKVALMRAFRGGRTEEEDEQEEDGAQATDPPAPAET